MSAGNGLEPDHDEDLDTSSAAIRLAVSLLQFVCELAMLALLAIGGWELGGGGLLGIALAVLYPAIALLVWAVWLAPRSNERLADPWRLLVQIALFAATGVVVAIGGHLTIGIVFAVVAVAAFVAERFLSA